MEANRMSSFLRIRINKNVKECNTPSSSSTASTGESSSYSNNSVLRRLGRTLSNLYQEEHIDESLKNSNYVKVLFPTTKEIYEGPMKNGLRHGDGGVCTWPNGTKFLGRFDSDEPIEGTLISSACTYVGKLSKSVFHGKGMLVFSDGISYEGEFLHGEYHGMGKLKEINGSVYTGSFEKGTKDGVGTLLNEDNNYCYSGHWVRNNRQGDGNETCKDEVFEGRFYRNKRHGNGILKKSDGLILEGSWKAGIPLSGSGWDIFFSDGGKYSGDAKMLELILEPHGNGTFRYADNSVYTGEFLEGKRSGKGVCIFENGNVVEGYWEDDKPVEMNFETMEAMETTSQEEGTSVIVPPPQDIDCCESVTTALSFLTTDDSTRSDDLPTQHYTNGDYFVGRIDRRGLRQGKGFYKELSSGHSYDGHWLNSMKHGKGTLITPYYEYCGDFSKDEFGGIGSLIYQDSSSYTGQFKNGKFDGRGTLIESDGRVYKGTLQSGLRHGHGRQTSTDDATYNGEYANGKRHGLGTLSSSKDVLYMGLWKDDHKDGEGILFYHDHPSFHKWEGLFVRNQQSGEGMLTYKDGTNIKGKWLRDNPMDGQWMITYQDGSHYSGHATLSSESSIPLPNGQGTMNYINGDVYTGEFHDSKREGNGKCVFANQDQWDGTWENDGYNMNCIGVLTLQDGTIHKFDGAVQH